MTIREYIQDRLRSLHLSESDFINLGMESGLDIDTEYTADNMNAVNQSMVGMIEACLFAPRIKSINEAGFSESWDYADLGKFYLWLCRKYGIKPDDEALAMMGVTVIRNISDMW